VASNIIPYSQFIIFIFSVNQRENGYSMAHCPNCGKEVDRPSRVLKNYSFTIEAYNCKKCHTNFKVTINHSLYM
jgi:predicted RNA-binding Zn-ribbon protein involved in translation (DUF1610 family)